VVLDRRRVCRQPDEYSGEQNYTDDKDFKTRVIPDFATPFIPRLTAFFCRYDLIEKIGKSC
jgi:hypothetical protein